MHSYFETERLYLKPTDIHDAPFLYELLNSPKWIKYIGDRQIKNVTEAQMYIELNMLPQYKRLGFGNFTLIRKIDKVKIGSCGLYDREGLDGLDIGYALLEQYEKQGFAYEAASKIMELASTTFDILEIYAITTKENLASQNLLNKLGLSFKKMITLLDDKEELMLFYKHL